MTVIPFHFGTWPKDSAFSFTTPTTLDVQDLRKESKKETVQLVQQPDEKTTSYADWITSTLAVLEKGPKAIVLSPEVSLPFNQTTLAYHLGALLERNCPLTQHRGPSRDVDSETDIIKGLTMNGTNGEHEPFNPRTNRQVWIRVPLLRKDGKTMDQVYDEAWQWWTEFRQAVGPNPKLGVLLEFDTVFPETRIKVNRWFGERFRASILPDDGNAARRQTTADSVRHDLFHYPNNTIFVRGSSSKAQQEFVKEFEDFRKAMDYHTLYYDENAGMRDTPLTMLQTVQDHLSEDIYKFFESGRNKYELYHLAIYESLRVRQEQGRLPPTVFAMVVGAGRGPLATEFIRAAEALKLTWKLYCIDKNPIAIGVMKRRMADPKDVFHIHQSKITIIHQDMRELNQNDKCDIMISELLGPFACNELSPECLDGAQALLKEDGIMIPWAYDSFLRPVQSLSYFEDVNCFGPKELRLENDPSTVSGRSLALISNNYERAWRFTHPNYEPHTNEREIELRFIAQDDYMLTGFAGYFELFLTRIVAMNTLPERYTYGMGNWCQAYFSLPKVVPVKKGQEIRVHIARRVRESENKVWYEWALVAPERLHLQNSRPDYWFGMQPKDKLQNQQQQNGANGHH